MWLNFRLFFGANGDVSPGPSRQKISTLINDDAIMWLNFRLFSANSSNSFRSMKQLKYYHTLIMMHYVAEFLVIQYQIMKQFRNQCHTLVIVGGSIRQTGSS